MKNFRWHLSIIALTAIFLILSYASLPSNNQPPPSVKHLLTAIVHAQVPGCSINQEMETTLGDCYTLNSTSTCTISGQTVIIACSLSSCDGGKTIQGGCGPFLPPSDRPVFE